MDSAQSHERTQWSGPTSGPIQPIARLDKLAKDLPAV